MSFPLPIAEEITNSLNAIALATHPSAGRRTMYGGVVFEEEPGNPKSMVCGHVIYTQHVRLEFSKGCLLDDPSNVLECNGKFRCHFELTQPSDFEAKICSTNDRTSIFLI